MENSPDSFPFSRSVGRAPKSNGVVFWPVGVGVAAGLAILARSDLTEAARFTGAMSLLSLLFFGTAVAELRSGHAWRNLAPGNRGVSKILDPAVFGRSVALHLLLGVTLLGIGLLGR